MLQTKVLFTIGVTFRKAKDTPCISYGTGNVVLFWPFSALLVATRLIALPYQIK